MPIRPFPAKSRYHSQEFIGGAITSLDQGYLLAYIDGGARGNPGPAGYGVVFEDEVGRPVAELSEFLGGQTNNYAEYSGLLAALNYTLRHGFKALKVVSDSELMVKQIVGEYKVSSPALKELHERAMKLIDQLECFEISHVPREKNRQADRLANVAMDRGIAKKAPAVNATDVGGVASVVPEINGVVRGGVVQFMGTPLPEGTLVKIRPVNS
ncbi:MAG TPA: ribonuclease HI family protein [Candidatus Binatia bacterium]|nr:ribonuclease HI family protein [Candidatus Binatia bacterium]